MANSNPQLSAAAANGRADNLTARLNDGYLRIYDGDQPGTPDEAISSQILLAELRFATQAFTGSTSRVATANAILPDSDARATGDAAWFRAFRSDGTTAVLDGTVGTADADCNISAIAIQRHAAISCTSMTINEA